jgi:hypothetical protein
MIDIELRKFKLRIPDWVQGVLAIYENKVEPHNEVELSDVLRQAARAHEDMPPEDFKGYYSEWSAFLFIERLRKDSLWGTFFAPMMTATRNDGKRLLSPDIEDLDAEVVSRWEERARSVKDPVMRARYADLVWDLKRAITNERPSHEFAQIAIDAYVEATAASLYTIDIEGVKSLQRALDLSLAIHDKQRAQGTVKFMFEFYDRVVDPRYAGVWIFPFDTLYDKKGLLTPEQEVRIISDLEKMLERTSGNSKPEEFDPFGAQAAAERLARHYNAANDRSSVQRVIKTYGQSFEQIAKEASPMLAMAWLQPVVERYEQEGLKLDAEELRLLSAKKGERISDDLKQFSVKVEVKQKDMDDLVDHLLGSGDVRKSLDRIAAYFIPKADEAQKLVEKIKTDAPLMSMIPITIIEKDGRPTAKIGSIDEDAEGRLYKQLGETISFYQPFLGFVLEKLREKYAPSVEDMLGYLDQSPLFSESRRELLQEGLRAYEQGDFVKAIHVLVPQIEQSLRNLLSLLQIPTTKTVARHPGIEDVKSMNDVLADLRVRQAMTENLWRYLSAVYIERRGGLNLRNDLAHGLVSPKSFNRSISDRVVHTLLAVSLMRAQETKHE